GSVEARRLEDIHRHASRVCAVVPGRRAHARHGDAAGACRLGRLRSTGRGHHRLLRELGYRSDQRRLSAAALACVFFRVPMSLAAADTMPHITVEYTANLKPEADIPGLLAKINDVLIAQNGVFPVGGIRSRAIELSDFRIADGAADDAFVHVTVKIGAGRD